MDKMTLFYSKYTGDIKLISSGVVDFDIFMSSEMDMRSFCNKVTIDLVDDILKNPHDYYVNINDNTLKRKETKVYDIKLEN